MHNPVGIHAVLFREFGLRPFDDEVSQYLGFDGSTWFVRDVEWQELNGPFGNRARCIPVVDYIIEGHFRSHRDRALLKVVSQFSRCHEDCICYLLIVRVPGFAWCEDGGYIVYRLLKRELMSVLLLFDNKHCAYNLVCCSYI